MSLNLKNQEKERLARELAQKTGENLTVAVTVALRERLERHDQAPCREGRLERLIKIVKQTAPRLKDSRPSKELFDELYDEAGLPK